MGDSIAKTVEASEMLLVQEVARQKEARQQKTATQRDIKNNAARKDKSQRELTTLQNQLKDAAAKTPGVVKSGEQVANELYNLDIQIEKYQKEAEELKALLDSNPPESTLSTQTSNSASGSNGGSVGFLRKLSFSKNTKR